MDYLDPFKSGFWPSFVVEAGLVALAYNIALEMAAAYMLVSSLEPLTVASIDHQILLVAHLR